LDAGLILILTAVDLSEDDLAVFHDNLPEGKLISIETSLNEPSKLSVKLHIPSGQLLEQSLEDIYQLLITEGVIWA